MSVTRLVLFDLERVNLAGNNVQRHLSRGQPAQSQGVGPGVPKNFGIPHQRPYGWQTTTKFCMTIKLDGRKFRYTVDRAAGCRQMFCDTNVDARSIAVANLVVRRLLCSLKWYGITEYVNKAADAVVSCWWTQNSSAISYGGKTFRGEPTLCSFS